MKTSINPTDHRWLVASKRDLCRIAMDHAGQSMAYTCAAPPYGDILRSPDASTMIGDLCYMARLLGWSEEQYRQAYGLVPGIKGMRTDNLSICSMDGWHILVIPCGGDGGSPIDGIGLDTGSVSIVSRDADLIRRIQLACVAHMESRREANQAIRDAEPEYGWSIVQLPRQATARQAAMLERRGYTWSGSKLQWVSPATRANAEKKSAAIRGLKTLGAAVVAVIADEKWGAPRNPDSMIPLEQSELITVTP